MNKPELADRLAMTLDDIDALTEEKRKYLETWRDRMTILHNDLNEFRKDVVQMRLDEVAE
jgi:hypothetical protein